MGNDQTHLLWFSTFKIIIKDGIGANVIYCCSCITSYSCWLIYCSYHAKFKHNIDKILDFFPRFTVVWFLNIYSPWILTYSVTNLRYVIQVLLVNSMQDYIDNLKVSFKIIHHFCKKLLRILYNYKKVIRNLQVLAGSYKILVVSYSKILYETYKFLIEYYKKLIVSYSLLLVWPFEACNCTSTLRPIPKLK